MTHHKKLAVLALTMAVIGGSAYAANEKANEVQAISQTKTSLTQAIATAEQHVKGKASRADLEQGKSGWIYDVEVVSGQTIFDVRIDAASGAVLASTEGRSEHDGDHNNQDEQDGQDD